MPWKAVTRLADDVLHKLDKTWGSGAGDQNNTQCGGGRRRGGFAAVYCRLLAQRSVRRGNETTRETMIRRLHEAPRRSKLDREKQPSSSNTHTGGSQSTFYRLPNRARPINATMFGIHDELTCLVGGLKALCPRPKAGERPPEKHSGIVQFV